MNKFIAILIIIILVSVLFYWLSSVLFFTAEDEPDGSGQTPITSTESIQDFLEDDVSGGASFDPDAPVQYVKAQEGQILPVSNLTAQPGVQTLDDDLFVLGEDDGAEQYSIYYYTDDNLIYIYLYSEPLETIRLLAEQTLVGKLRKPDGTSLTDKEICALDISVSTNEYVSRAFAGLDLGLSFCPGSVQF